MLLSWNHVFSLDVSLTVCYVLPSPSLCVCSSWKPELQLQLRLRWSVRQPVLPAAPSSHLQALFCVSRQVLRLPLRRQRLRGLQGKNGWPVVCFTACSSLKGSLMRQVDSTKLYSLSGHCINVCHAVLWWNLWIDSKTHKRINIRY